MRCLKHQCRFDWNQWIAYSQDYFESIVINKSHLGYGGEETNTPTAKTQDRFARYVVHLIIKLRVKSDEQCTLQGEGTFFKKREREK